jgi:transmembrane sensor
MKTSDSSSAPRGTPPVAPSPATEPSTVLDWVRATGQGRQLRDELELFLRRRRRRCAQLAGTGAVLLIGALGFWQPWRTPAPLAADSSVPSTFVSRPESRPLPDGSVAELKRGAEVATAFSEHERRVVLRHGTAHFAVVRDAARPFVVEAAGVEVRAVGTAFAVEVAESGVDVLVTEGKVAVQAPAAKATAPTTLAAGDRAVVERGTTAPRVTSLSPEEVRQRLAWRVPRLEFVGTPLAQVVVMCNEHATALRRARLVLADPSLGAVRVSGLLRADDLDSLLRLLEGEFGIVADPSEGEIRLRRR